MFRIDLVAMLSDANSGHTVMAGNSSSFNLTLSMLLMLGFSFQSLKQWMIN